MTGRQAGRIHGGSCALSRTSSVLNYFCGTPAGLLLVRKAACTTVSSSGFISSSRAVVTDHGPGDVATTRNDILYIGTDDGCNRPPRICKTARLTHLSTRKIEIRFLYKYTICSNYLISSCSLVGHCLTALTASVQTPFEGF